MKMTNKIVLGVSGIVGGLFIFFLLALLYNFCGPYRQICKDIYTPIAYVAFSFPFVFLLSLITYRMRDEVFRAWWNFARWWVPVIILVTYLQSTQSGGGGLGIGGAMSSAFDAFILGFFYAVLVIVSLWRIVRKYRQMKREGK